MATYKTFVRGKEKYSISEKKQLGELVFLFSTIFHSKSS